MKNVEMVAWWLVIIGAINWGVLALFNTNLVSEVFGSVQPLEKLIYVLVGLSGVYLVLKRLKVM